MIKNPAIFVSKNDHTHERFAIRPTTGAEKINFWYVINGHKYFYTFFETGTYNRNSVWTEDMCHQLFRDLMKNPEVKLVRYAIDDTYIFNSEEKNDSPVPKMPKLSQELEEHLEKMKHIKKRDNLERKYHSGLAPYILYGKHSDYENEKEYAWKLTPDKKKRSGIKPGDKVLVWTRFGNKIITVTRIEKAKAGQTQPEYRVRKKLIKK